MCLRKSIADSFILPVCIVQRLAVRIEQPRVCSFQFRIFIVSVLPSFRIELLSIRIGEILQLQELGSIQYIQFFRKNTYTEVGIVTNTSTHTFTFFGCNQNNTIRTSGTVDGCCRRIFQDFYRLDIVRIQIVDRRCSVGQCADIQNHTVHHIKRVVRYADRRVTTDTDGSTSARTT